MFSADDRDCSKDTEVENLVSNIPEFLRLDDAGNIMVRFIDLNMHRMPSFASREFNIVPDSFTDHQNTRRVREFSPSVAS